MPLEPELVATFDAVLIVTDDDGIDYQGLVDAARLVVDTRNATRRARGRDAKVIRA